MYALNALLTLVMYAVARALVELGDVSYLEISIGHVVSFKKVAVSGQRHQTQHPAYQW